MSAVLQNLATFFLYAVLAVFAQNAIFTRGLGVSRLIKLVNDDAVGTMQFWALLTVIQVLTAPMGYFCLTVVAPMLGDYRQALRPALYIGCALIVFIIVNLVLHLICPARMEELCRTLPLAAFNTSVLGTLLICSTQSYSLPQYIGFSFGSALGYLMAVLVVDEAERRLQNKSVPRIFRGMPITLIYIGMLALAIYGFTGHSLSI